MVAIYHITHIDNLGSIAAMGLYSDIERRKQNFSSTNIGYEHIKERRLTRQVNVCEEGVIGDYVPFNFCPRSVMLYVINQGGTGVENGQLNIVHLVSDTDIIGLGYSSFFTDIHAELDSANQYDDLDSLNENLNWTAIESSYWGGCEETKKAKQAEYLVYNNVSWEAISRIVVIDESIKLMVEHVINGLTHQPVVEVNRGWYY